LFLPPELPVNDAGSTLVVTGTKLLLVLVNCKVLPSLTLVMIVVYSCTELVVIKVLDTDALCVTVLTVDV
jgi:hypothetical protein